MPLERSVDAIIREAMRRGDFDDLPGRGKPVDLGDYFNTPEELRMAYSILRSADVLPRELELLKEIAGLKERLESCKDDDQSREIHKSMQNKLLQYNLLMEGRRKK